MRFLRKLYIEITKRINISQFVLAVVLVHAHILVAGVVSAFFSSLLFSSSLFSSNLQTDPVTCIATRSLTFSDNLDNFTPLQT